MPIRIFLEETPLRLQPDHAAPAITLPFDLASLLAAGLSRFPPSGAALENAIATVEDALMPHVAALRRYPLDVLQGDGSLLQDIARATGRGAPVQQGLRLSIEEVERLFNRLADVAAGMPARTQEIPESPRFVAALLVVREILHHVGYQWLEITARND